MNLEIKKEDGLKYFSEETIDKIFNTIKEGMDPWKEELLELPPGKYVDSVVIVEEVDIKGCGQHNLYIQFSVFPVFKRLAIMPIADDLMGVQASLHRIIIFEKDNIPDSVLDGINAHKKLADKYGDFRDILRKNH